MPRKPRIHYPGAVYHVILRGNAGLPVFFRKRDRFKFYLFLQESVQRFSCNIHGFCLMRNHVHLIIQVNQAPLSVIMQNLALRYTKWINFSQSRTGHIFQGRYKAILLDADEYLLELVRYVHLNPVRAELVKRPEEYPWSGHRAYLGEEVLPWLTTNLVLSLMGQSLEASREAYRQFAREGLDEGRRCEFHSGTCEGRILGDERFIDETFDESHQERPPAWTLATLISIICNRYGITEEELSSPGKARPFSEARALAAVMVIEAPHLHLTQLGTLLNRDMSALSKAAQRMLQQSRIDQSVAREINAVRVVLAACPNVEPDPKV